MTQILDEALPAGVLDSVETEQLWEACMQHHGTQAWVEWPKYRADHEQSDECQA